MKIAKLIKGLTIISALALTPLAFANNLTASNETIAKALGWVESNENRCGGYYLEPAISSAESAEHPDLIQITSNQFLYSFHGTSESQGKTTIRRYGQEITSNKALLYRDKTTNKLTGVDLLGNVVLREANTVVLADHGQFDFQTKTPTLLDIVYRMPIYSALTKNQHIPAELETEHKIFQLSAYGQAVSFTKTEPRVYEMNNASYTSCPPTRPVWKVKTSHLVLNKNTGRGYATHARLFVKNIPVFYVPYLNFPIDSRRATGFLWPTVGTSSQAGWHASVPYYWNMAPNYDMLITPDLLSKRGLKITDLYRYLTHKSSGQIQLSVLPNDRLFKAYQSASEETYGTSQDPITQANLNRLLTANTTRTSLFWRDETRYNDNWFASVDYNHVSDDYYLQDLSNNINVVSQNQLLQQASLTYKNQYWYMYGRVQGYQTLHLVDGPVIENQYNRLPQFIFNGVLPNTPADTEIFSNDELTHFTIHNTPGTDTQMPMGNRLNIQPGISKAFNWPYLYINPRFQVAMTKYVLDNINNNIESAIPSRILPIIDASSGMYFDRNLTLFHYPLLQTLEPKVYYTYIPYKNQSDLPVFDTTLNTLTYDQLFLYNRFSSLDRIGDTNQVAVGLTTRFYDLNSGNEKIRASIGQIFYFKKRLVTLCQGPTCAGQPIPEENKLNRSPLSGNLTYSLSPHWTITADSIWDAKTGDLNNQTAQVHYESDSNQIVNLGYSLVRGYPQSSIIRGFNPNTLSTRLYLSQTDLSFAVPVSRDWTLVSRWTENWNNRNFQNLLFGVEYNSCCWAVRLVAGREFIGATSNNTSLYNTEAYIQFALKGLGNFGSGDPTSILASSVSGYKSQLFGQDF